MVLERGADGLESSIPDVGRAVNQVEILARRLPNESWVRVPEVDLGPNLAPQRPKYLRTSREVQCCKVAVVENRVGDLLSVAGDELQYTGGEPCFDHDLVEEPARQESSGTGFPHDHVAHDQRGENEVNCQSGEVEW